MADKNKTANKIRDEVMKKIARELEKHNLPPDVVKAMKLYANDVKAIEKSEQESTDSEAEIEQSSEDVEGRVVRVSESVRKSMPEDFWDIGKPKERVYAPCEFSSDSLAVSEVADDKHDKAESTSFKGEKIPRRDYPSQTMNPFTSIPNRPHGKSVVTGSYKRAVPKPPPPPPRPDIPIEQSEPKIYEKNGTLIKKITVNDWRIGNDFYTRFAADAQKSHLARPKASPDEPMHPVQFYSLVPQFSHMTGLQIEYYRRLRELWRQNSFPDCDSAYVMLYVFELLNLSDVDKAEISSSLASVWLGYRKRMPRLDAYMSEWMEDYCMINDVPLPKELFPSLAEITTKSHFKEFYYEEMLRDGEDYTSFAKAFIDGFSDYVYANAKYYPEYKESYDEHIIACISLVMREGIKKRFAIFCEKKTYRMMIDSYIGGAVASSKKKQIIVEFESFLRGIEVREYATAIVKYAENKLRQSLGIKGKLSVKKIDSESVYLIDSYFEPLIPRERVKKPAEDKYMPDDYMKNYEAETRGVDIAAAAEIERMSWTNTARLTAFDEDEDLLENKTATDVVIPEVEIAKEVEKAEKCANTDTKTTEKCVSDEEFMKKAVSAALDGRFKQWAKECGIYEGEAQDRVNNCFIDIIGDIILEDYTLIEDYREDVEEWMK